nr:unnamed protein product [Digitaria exilis]
MQGRGIVDRLTAKNEEVRSEQIRGTVVLAKKGVLDVGNKQPSLLDGGVDDGAVRWGHHVTLQLVSATAGDDPTNEQEGRGKVGKAARLEELTLTMKSRAEGESVFWVMFDWDESQGIPGAVIVNNRRRDEFFLKTLTLEGVPGKGTVVFIANSWIYPHKFYSHDRIFFANDMAAKTAHGRSLGAAKSVHIPVVAELAVHLQKLEFPPKSGLDPSKYGDHTSKITQAVIEPHLEAGLTAENALRDNKLFIVDYHDRFILFLDRINKLRGNFIYASRTLLLLKNDGTMKPLAIELSLPHDDAPKHGAKSNVYTPASAGVERHIWQLAKAYASVNDDAWHQIVSHWLNTHMVMEPFVIATNRQLSVVHPVHKLLSPHYRNTMQINAQARHMLLNAGGLFETFLVFPGKYALEMSSAVYKDWNLTEQALPNDLLKRGVAVPDPSSPCGVRLLIKDYPYAVDGLAIWWAIELWVDEYLDIYYPNDGELRRDTELQAWWKEVREVGHGDLKDRDWWPKMDTVQDLVRTCTTIIWIASALHAAVNFGHYSYSGYIPNRPTMSRRPMPEPGTMEYAQLEQGGQEADKVFIRTITGKFQTILALSCMQILSSHSSDEVYLGQREEPERWTSDARALDAFKRFGRRLQEIEQRIVKMNSEKKSFRNRSGPVDVPYMLVYPNTSDMGGKQGEGLTAMGIPNSISIFFSFPPHLNFLCSFLV